MGTGSGELDLCLLSFGEIPLTNVKVIHYLCSVYSPTARQTDEGVARLADELQDHDLTKGEVLQICNLAPTLPVELYCVSQLRHSVLYIIAFSILSTACMV